MLTNYIINNHKLERVDSVKAIQVLTRIKKSDIEKFRINEEYFEDLNEEKDDRKRA